MWFDPKKNCEASRQQSGSRFHAYEQKKENFLILHAAMSRLVHVHDIKRPDELKNVRANWQDKGRGEQITRHLLFAFCCLLFVFVFVFCVRMCVCSGVIGLGSMPLLRLYCCELVSGGVFPDGWNENVDVEVCGFGVCIQALVEFCVELETVQNNLCVHVSYIPEIKKTKKSGQSSFSSFADSVHSLFVCGGAPTL